MCSAFSQIQTLNKGRMGQDKYEDMIRKATVHLEFCAKLYKIQMDRGRYFLHEHPASAKSWENDMMSRLSKDQRVYTIIGDMCRFKMTQQDEYGTGLVKKRTGFMTNAVMIAGRLAQRCDGGHRHIHLINCLLYTSDAADE